ncbi:MAG: branched-chain amino acid ABC transporter permease [Planctomycetes bacterium]|nr:branched-chain amino acid ABC transporter permease [Planctomycetota bacterium]
MWTSLALVAAIVFYPALAGDASERQNARETAFLVLLAIALASSLNILLGYSGYVSFGHIVFYGVGGYAGFYLISVRGWHLVPAVLAGALVAGLLALVLGLSILRLRGPYFALATIGISEAMKAFVKNFEPLGGSTGLTLHFSIYREYGGAAPALRTAYWGVALIAFLAVAMSFFVKRSRFGLGLLAIREDEDAAQGLGVAAPRAKTVAYVLSALLPGAVGVLVFFKNGVIEPESAFRLQLSIELLVMVMLGGQGTVLGPLVGAALYQQLRLKLLTTPFLRDFQLAVAGLLLLAIVLFLPAGAVGGLRAVARFLNRKMVLFLPAGAVEWLRARSRFLARLIE